jgi:S1-C subfamily serine protease
MFSSGLVPDDIVLSVDKKSDQNFRQLALDLYSYAVGESAKLKIQRGKQAISYEVPVVENLLLIGSQRNKTRFPNLEFWP